MNGQSFPMDMGPMPMQQQQRPAEIVDNFSQPLFQMDGETIRWQFDPTETLRDLERNLKGAFHNDRTNKWDIKTDAQLVNYAGMYNILSLVRVHLYKHVSLSHFTHEEINEIVHDVIIALIDKLELEWKKYEINRANLSTIRIMVENTIRANLLRALQGNAAKSLRDTHKSTEIFSAGGGPSMSGGKKKFGLF